MEGRNGRDGGGGMKCGPASEPMLIHWLHYSFNCDYFLVRITHTDTQMSNVVSNSLK